MTNIIETREQIKPSVTSIVAQMGKKLNLNSYSPLPDPDLIMQKGNIPIEFLGEIYNDPQVSAAMGLRKSQVQKLKWDIDRGKENEGATIFIREVIEKWDLPKLISGIIDSRAWGYSVFEYYWFQKEGKLVIEEVTQKPTKWFKFDTNSQLRFMSSNANSLGEICPKFKFLLVQNDSTYDNPYGSKLLSKCYWLVRFKKDTFKLWARFIEKYGMPFFVGKTGTPNTEVIKEFMSMLDSLSQDGVAIIDSDHDVEKISGNDTNSKEIYESFIQIMDKQISKVILNHSDALDATQGQLGNTSKALSTLDVIAMSDKELVETSINRIIRLLMEVNFSGFSHIPKFEMYEVTDVDLELANRDKVLSETGVQFTKEYYINAYGFRAEDFEIKAPAPAGPSFSEADNKINKIVNEMFAPFLEILDSGKSYDEAKKELFKSFNDVSDKEIEAIMAKILIQASDEVLNGKIV